MSPNSSSFVVTSKPSSRTVDASTTSQPGLRGLDVAFSGADVERLTTDRNNTVLIDGYALGISSKNLAVVMLKKKPAHSGRLLGLVAGA